MVGPTSDSVDASVVGAIAVVCELPNGELVLDADGAGIFVGGFDRPAELRNEGETVLGLSPVTCSETISPPSKEALLPF